MAKKKVVRVGWTNDTITEVAKDGCRWFCNKTQHEQCCKDKECWECDGKEDFRKCRKVRITAEEV